jgi:hypothetical protein
MMAKSENDDHTAVSATRARQGLVRYNVRTVLWVSLLLAAAAGVILVWYFWAYTTPPIQ